MSCIRATVCTSLRASRSREGDTANCKIQILRTLKSKRDVNFETFEFCSWQCPLLFFFMHITVARVHDTATRPFARLHLLETHPHRCVLRITDSVHTKTGTLELERLCRHILTIVCISLCIYGIVYNLYSRRKRFHVVKNIVVIKQEIFYKIIFIYLVTAEIIFYQNG